MDNRAARIWLKDNGYNVRPKGRIPSDLLAIYQARMKRANSRVGNDSVPVGTGSGSVPSKGVKRTSCGFCTVQAPHQHKHCPGTINQGKMGIWTCLCYEKEHTLYVLHL